VSFIQNLTISDSTICASTITVNSILTLSNSLLIVGNIITEKDSSILLSNSQIESSGCFSGNIILDYDLLNNTQGSIVVLTQNCKNYASVQTTVEFVPKENEECLKYQIQETATQLSILYSFDCNGNTRIGWEWTLIVWLLIILVIG